MTSEELKKLIKTGENGEVEFKRGHGGVPGDFWPSYSAFANTDGGVIVLGVCEKDGERVIEGVENAEKVRADLWNAANNPDKVSDNVLSNKRVYSLEIDGKVLVVEEVPRADRRVKPVYVGSDVKVPFKLDARSQRVNETKVHDVLREVLANALIHADYHGRRGIVIEKQFDTIVFRNPGDLRLAKEIAIEGGTTDARNSKIFNIFALIDVGERSGMGLSNLYSTWAELGYDRPELEEFHEPDQTVLKVYLKTSTKSAKTSTKKTSSKSEKTREKKTRGKKLAGAAAPLKNIGETAKTVGKDEKTREKKARVKSAETRKKKFDFPPEELVVLRLTAQRLIAVMRRNPQVTTAELAKELGVTDKGIEWQIVKLRKDKMIRRVGGRKFGSWEVLI